MLQFAAILTTGGIVLFSNVIDIDKSIFLTLINRIIDSKNLESTFTVLKYKVNYLYDPVLGLICVIGWRNQIILDYPEKLLHAMSVQSKSIHNKIIWKDNLIVDAPDFKEPWQRAFQDWKNYIAKKEQQGNVMRRFSQTEKGGKINKKLISQPTRFSAPVTIKQQDDTKNNTQAQKTENSVEDPDDGLTARQRFLKKQREKQKSRSPKQSKIKSPPKQDSQKREWVGGKVDAKVYQSLDRSKKQSNQNASPRSSLYSQISEEQNIQLQGYLDSDEQLDLSKQSKFFGKWMNKVKNIVGQKTITKQDIEEVIGEFKKKLMQKNVAQDVADKVAEAVGKTLLETKTKSFTTVYKTVNEALKQALRKILTPKKKIDLVVEITKHRQKMKPYVIVFIGVNGVGKSTNLAKVAYKLKNAKLSVMLAACDNFRAGAVQQIKTHGRNLDIPVFDRGYKQEPSNIAFEAIRDATRKRIDVVLIDTAGRMQDNQPLMRELAQIVKVNKPNLVVFIGQALVGNDAVDQISKFSKAVSQESTENYKAQINAILLSKFDTVDDKVGTALSLVYTTGKPILYVGVGQKYPNLKQLNVNTVVHSLLS